MDAFASWFLLPLVLAASSWGLGLLLERLLRTELDDGLVLPLGFAGSMVALSLPYGVGLGAPVATALLALPVAAGLWLGRRRLRASLPSLPLALSALAAYGLYLAPVALSGEATFAGYLLLGDTGVHFALVDHVVDHGSRMTDIPYSSYGNAVEVNLGNGYPLGPHYQLASLTTVLGTDVAWLYQAYVACTIALATIPAAHLLRSVGLGAWLAAAGGFVAVAAYLPFSYALQGGAKELAMVLFVLLGAVFSAELASGTRLLRVAGCLGIVMAAAFAVYSTGGLPWFLAMIAPAAVVAVRRGRVPLRRVAAAAGVLAGVFALAALASAESAVSFFEPAKRLLESSEGADVGNLLRQIPISEAFGVWFGDDYRAPPEEPGLTWWLVGLAAVLALVGAVHAFRVGALGLLLAAGACIAVWVLLPAGWYIEAKLIAIMSPALVLAGLAGCAALGRLHPAAGAIPALVLAAAILISDALAYHGVRLAPKPRFDEMAEIGERFAGPGPTMVTEFDEYGKHFLRDAGVFSVFEGYALQPPRLREPEPTYATWQDLDEMELDYVQEFRLIVSRRNPVESRPPAPYRLAFRGRHYEVWELRGPKARRHLPLGDGTDPTGPIPCPAVRSLAREAAGEPLLVAERPALHRLEARRMRPPGGWAEREDGAMVPLTPGELTASLRVPAGTYRVWVEGSFGRGADVLLDGRSIGRAERIQPPGQMSLVAEVELDGSPRRLSVLRGGGDLTPGNGLDEFYRTVILEPAEDPVVREVPPDRAASLCGRRADWVELGAG